MRLLEDLHPSEIVADGHGRLHGTQTLVVLSNLKRGFCLTLRRHASVDTPPMSWQLQPLRADGVMVSPAGDGWQLCAQRPGRYTLRMQHLFESNAPDGAPQALAWPVAADLAAL